MNIGDRVAYSARFVRDMGGGLYVVAQQRGTVTAVTFPLVAVRWDDGRETHAHASNLARVGSAKFSDAGTK